MKKIIGMLGVVVALFVASSMFWDSPVPNVKDVKQMEQVAVISTQVQLEHKEAYKLDDAEYTGAVATKFSGVSSEGVMIALISMLGLTLFMFWQKMKWYSKVALSMLFMGLVSMVDASLSAVYMYAVVPFIKFDKSGLEGDNLKFVNDLEQRIKGIEEEEVKKILSVDLKLAVREAMKQWERFEKLDETNVAKLKEMLGDDEKGVRSILLKQGEALTKLQQNISMAEERMDIRSQIVKWQADNKDALSKIKNKELANLPPLEIRAANSPMTPANTETNTITINAGAALRQGAPLFDLRRIEPTLWDYITKGRTGLETYPWVNKKVPASSGEAAFIGPGVAKPGASFTLEVEKSVAKKIAVSMKVATELLEDVDGMTTMIQNELTYLLKAKANTTLMTGVESGTVIAGVQTFSLPFTTAGLSTVNPNNWDVARVVIAQMRLAFITGPIVLFMNPIDTANMDMDKAVSLGMYTGISARPIPGGVIVEDNNVTVGYIQAISLDAWKNLIYKDFMIKYGWENDDFTKNLVTVIAELRMHSFHSANDAAGFVYDDIADIKSQIAAA